MSTIHVRHEVRSQWARAVAWSCLVLTAGFGFPTACSDGDAETNDSHSSPTDAATTDTATTDAATTDTATTDTATTDTATTDTATTDTATTDTATTDTATTDTGASDANPTNAGPSVNDVPGGPVGSAAIVGCNQAERPARRAPAAVAQCEAVGTAKCWFVSPEGSDSAAGTFASPFGRPQTAVRQAGPGDVIYLRGGVYTDLNAHDVQPVSWNDPSQGTTRGFISIRAIQLPDWAGGDDYGVQNGTAAAPITIKSFPGERACATGAGSILVGSLRKSQEVAHWRIEDRTLHQGAVIVSGGAQGANGLPVDQVHDIIIRRNEIYEYSKSGPNNPGLVKVDRGNWGGPYAITVESNILHDILPIDPDGVVRDWSTTQDTQHFGAISMLSCER